MPYDIFSKRGKSPPDVFVYDDIPITLRNQVILIWRDVTSDSFEPPDLYRSVVRILRKEYGVLRLPLAALIDNDEMELRRFFLNEKSAKRVIDVIEVSLYVLSTWSTEVSFPALAVTHVDSAIAEVNQRFREHGIGYEFIDGKQSG